MKHSKNYLTIHLYRRDEALASIRWAILSRNHTEAVFWGLELYDSNMEQDAIQVLASTWVSRIGFGCMAALDSLQVLDTADRETWCQTLMAWCRIRVHDTTIFHILLRGSIYSWQPRFAHSKEYRTLKSALEDTLERRKLLEAWCICRGMTPASQWTIFEHMAKQKGLESQYSSIRTSVLTDVEKRAAVCGLLTLRPAIVVLPDGTLPIELAQAIAAWDAEDSLRKRRVFKVKPEAITYSCQRSSQPVSESNELEIQDDLEKTLVSSPYWQEVLKSQMKSTKMTDKKTVEREREKFYEVFFPCDIPDEWSSADREKSHGRGLGKTDEQACNQYVHATVHGSTTLGLWNSILPSDVSSLDWPTLYSKLHTIQLPIKSITKEFTIV